MRFRRSRQPSEEPAPKDQPEETVELLGEEELAHVHGRVEHVREALRAAGINDGELVPEALDQLLAQLRDASPEDPLAVANLVGPAVGQLLVDGVGFEWVSVTDEHGTELAVRRPGLMIFPAGYVMQGIDRSSISQSYEIVTQMAELPRMPSATVVLGRPETLGSHRSRKVWSTPLNEVDEQVRALDEGEKAWVAENVEAARQALTDRGIELTGRVSAEALDRLWASLVGEEPDDPNPAINLVGCALGQLWVDEHGVSWVAITDEYGTDLAVRGDSDFTIFPTNFIAKRWDTRETDFIADAYRDMSRKLHEIRDG